MDGGPSYGLSQLSALNTEAMEILPPLGSSDEQSSPSRESLDLRGFLDELPIYVMVLATLVACVTYQAGLKPPGGIWVDTESEHGRFQGSNKLKDVPWKGSQTLVSWTVVIIVLVCLFGAQAGNLSHFIYTGWTWLVSAWSPIEDTDTLSNLFKAQADCNLASASRDSEFEYMGSYTETEPENTSCSDSMAAIIAVSKTTATWLVGSASTRHATGNRNLLSNFQTVYDLNIKTGDGVPMPVRGRGCVITDTIVLPDVLFVPELKKNIVSVSQLAQLGCSIEFKRDACYISAATDGTAIGKALVGEDGMFKLEFLKVPLVN